MKKIHINETAKKLQRNYRAKVRKQFKNILTRLDGSHRFRNDKAARLALLSELEKCTIVSGKKPTIDSADIFQLLAPFCFEEHVEDQVVRMIRTRIPTLDYISKDLSFLKKEFNGIEINGNILSVTTDDVVLRDINFGPFKMFFDLSNDIPKYYDDVRVYVEALRPNYPSGCDCHPHPHVEDRHLCTGYGRRAIWATLKELRLFDYFQVINIILNTYGEGPYEDISSWDNEQCNDCGRREYPDDMNWCPRCEERYCYDCCNRECIECGEYYCAFCMTSSCGACSENICPSCIVSTCR
jgi:hypothetical protein